MNRFKLEKKNLLNLKKNSK